MVPGMPPARLIWVKPVMPPRRRIPAVPDANGSGVRQIAEGNREHKGVYEETE